jgi:Fe2+ transport system protein FeoA
MITTLEQLKDGDQAVVLEISGGYAVRQRLSHLGLHPQDKIEVIRSGYFGGPVLIEVHGVDVGIGHGMAQKVRVEIQEQK